MVHIYFIYRVAHAVKCVCVLGLLFPHGLCIYGSKLIFRSILLGVTHVLLQCVEVSLGEIFGFPSASFPQTPSVQNQALHHTSVRGSHPDWVGGFKLCPTAYINKI